MFEDRYGNAVTTRSAEARDAYVEAVDCFLASNTGVVPAFERAIAADDGFALAHLGLARHFQVSGQAAAAKEALASARGLTDGLTSREASHIHALGLLVGGKPADAYPAIRAHLVDHPRDAMLAQTCTTVFGLIGFSGLPGREAEQLAFTAELAPHYGDDWWFLSQHAFSQVEVGQIGLAEANIERSLHLNPRSAQGAHIRSHVYYEAGETDAGIGFLTDWLGDYDRTGLLHGHLSWHEALWALEQGRFDETWQIIDSRIAPDANAGPPLVVLCDIAAVLFRAVLVGIEVPPDRWVSVAHYAENHFPRTGIAFSDVHAAMAYAMAGDSAQLARVIADAKGPAAGVVAALAEAFGAMAQEDWAGAVALLTPVMPEHARIGGSKAQRDLIEFAMVVALLRQGQDAEAQRLLAMRRPVVSEHFAALKRGVAEARH